MQRVHVLNPWNTHNESVFSLSLSDICESAGTHKMQPSSQSGRPNSGSGLQRLPEPILAIKTVLTSWLINYYCWREEKIMRDGISIQTWTAFMTNVLLGPDGTLITSFQQPTAWLPPLFSHYSIRFTHDNQHSRRKMQYAPGNGRNARIFRNNPQNKSILYNIYFNIVDPGVSAFCALLPWV